jgi:phosphohistidine swiveling domain-containing protein
MNTNIFAKKKWYMQGCLGVPAHAGIPLRIIPHILGKGCTLDVYRGEKNQSYFDVDKEHAIAMQHVRRQLDDINYIDRMHDSWKIVANKILERVAEGCEFEDIGLPLEEAWKIAWIIELFDPHGDRVLNEHVKLSEEQRIGLFVPTNLTNIQKERIDLLKLSLANSASESSTDLAIHNKNHQQKYYFIFVSYSDARPYTEEMIKEKLKTETKRPADARKEEIKNIESAHYASVKKKDHLFSKLKGKERNIVHFFQRIVDWREERKEFVQKINNYVYNLLKQEEKKTGIKLELLRFVDIYNCRSELSKKDAEKMLEERSRLCAATLNEKGEFTYYTGKDASDIIDFIENEFLGSKKEVTGTTASKGKAEGNAIEGNVVKGSVVKGRVKLIMEAADFNEFKHGDILVTIMTRPEMLPIMKKASAIVTDEGGITCHAAIVARELGIPCIIGTQISTKVLKDGDIVEVDADKGVVKKINNR